MKVRDLKIVNSGNLTGAKEFNILRVVNIDEFLATNLNNLDFYRSPFQILADLEEAIKFENSPDSTVTVPYKDEGDVIFDLVGIEEKDNARIVKYEFATFIS